MIVLLLVIIILLIAPWMFWWFVGAVATWVLVFSGLCMAALVVWPAFRVYRAAFPPKDPAALRLAAKNKEFNRQYFAQANSVRLVDTDQPTNGQPLEVEHQAGKDKKIDAPPHTPKTINCANCGVLAPKFGMYCPACGKDPRKINSLTN